MNCLPCIMPDFIKAKPVRILTSDEVIELSCNFFNIPKTIITKKCRKREIVEARQMIQTYLHKNNYATLKGVGELTGGKDHTTVMHAKQVVKDLCDTDERFKQRWYNYIDFIDSQKTYNTAA